MFLCCFLFQNPNSSGHDQPWGKDIKKGTDDLGLCHCNAYTLAAQVTTVLSTSISSCRESANRRSFTATKRSNRKILQTSANCDKLFWGLLYKSLQIKVETRHGNWDTIQRLTHQRNQKLLSVSLNQNFGAKSRSRSWGLTLIKDQCLKARMYLSCFQDPLSFHYYNEYTGWWIGFPNKEFDNPEYIYIYIYTG